MNEKIKNWIVIGSFVILLIAVFFAGRSCGSSQSRELANQIKTELASSVEGQRKLTEALERERGFVNTLRSINNRLVGRIDRLEESIDQGYQRIEEGIKSQRKLIEGITTLNGLSRDATDSIGNKLTESVNIIESLLQATDEEID